MAETIATRRSSLVPDLAGLSRRWRGATSTSPPYAGSMRDRSSACRWSRVERSSARSGWSRRDRSPGYDSDDLRLAEELADRASLWIDNARLYFVAQGAIRARDDVLGVVAHDLRNPLNTVALCASR